MAWIGNGDNLIYFLLTGAAVILKIWIKVVNLIKELGAVDGR